MKITKSQLKQIIKEELEDIISESEWQDNIESYESERERTRTLYPIGTKVRPVSKENSVDGKDHYLRNVKTWGTVVELPWNVKSTADPDHIAVTWQGAGIDFETDKPYAHLFKPHELEIIDASAEG